MEINEDEFYYGKDNKYFNEEQALAWLLVQGYLFANTGWFGEGEEKTATVVLFLNCNDTFMWGCADGESVTRKEIRSLYEAIKNDKKWGSTKWVCKKRNEKPQYPIIYDMNKDGSWDAHMSSLADNGYNAHVDWPQEPVEDWRK